MNKKTKTSISQLIVNKLKDANLILESTPVAKHIYLVLHTVSADQNNLISKTNSYKSPKFLISQQLIWKIRKFWYCSRCHDKRRWLLDIITVQRANMWRQFLKKFSFQDLFAEKTIKTSFIGTEINCLID